MSAARGASSGKSNSELSPGEHLRREIERLGFDQAGVSKALGVTRQAINNVVNDRQPISRAMAAKLGRLMGRSSDYWLRESYPRRGRMREHDSARPIGVLVNHQIIRVVKDGILGIDPFVTTNVRSAAIELTLDEDIVTSDERTTDISGRNTFLLAPGSTVRGKTKERIGFPLDYLGRIGALPRLVSSSIITSIALQVAPGFKGQVPFCMFNAGAAPFQLRAGDPMLSLEITALRWVATA